MKQCILFLGTFFLLLISVSYGQNANRTLSNLTSPTRVNADLLPDTSNTVNLGSTALGWKDLHLRGDIYLDGNRFISNFPGIAARNVLVGANAGGALTTGSYNTAVGYNSMLNAKTGNNNTALGANTLFYNTSGNFNAAQGRGALYHNTTGSGNTAVGNLALTANTTGYSNIAIGSMALGTNITGNNSIAIGDSALFNSNNNYHNVAVGSKALYSNTTGYYNVALGYRALYSNTTSGYNTGVGYQALFANTGDAYDNTAAGFQALYTNTTGSKNTAHGVWALLNNTTGNNNVATGVYALEQNSKGNDNVAAGFYSAFYTTGNSNVALGSHALFSNTSASNTVAIGDSACYSQSTALYNTSVGSKALYSNTASANTAIGFQALKANVSGTNNTAAGTYAMLDNKGSYNTTIGAYSGYYSSTNGTFIGWDTYGASAGSTNSTALGYHAPTTASNQIRLGDGNVTSIGGQVGFSSFSDGRFKKNIKENVPGLEFINQLRPVTYNFDAVAFDQALSAITPRPNNEDDKITREQALKDKAAATEKSKMLYTGFIAQEVETAAKKMNYDFSGVDAPKNDKDYYGLRYGDFVVPLVKAVQQLSTQNDSLRAQNAALETRLETIEKLLKINTGAVALKEASLGQNIPNPFNKTTTIAYHLPQRFASAQLWITNAAGKLIKTIRLTGSGRGFLSVDANILAAGAYQYTLYVDNKLIDTKKMALVKQ